MKNTIVIDTNVLVSALKSRLGRSFKLLNLIGTGAFDHVVTVPLMMEYEDVLSRKGMTAMPQSAIDAVLDFICATGLRKKVHFLWRPQLTDIYDDMVLEAAVNGKCQYIVTYNLQDFKPASKFGVKVITPMQFLNLIKEN